MVFSLKVASLDLGLTKKLSARHQIKHNTKHWEPYQYRTEGIYPLSAAFEATKATNMENFHSTKTAVQNTGLRLEA
jgi:hypothetical protein